MVTVLTNKNNNNTAGRKKLTNAKIFVSDQKHKHLKNTSANQYSNQNHRLKVTPHDSGCAKSVTNTILIGLLNRNDLPKPIKHFDTNCLPLLKM